MQRRMQPLHCLKSLHNFVVSDIPAVVRGEVRCDADVVGAECPRSSSVQWWQEYTLRTGPVGHGSMRA